MSVVNKKQAVRGSQRWLQEMINRNPEPANREIRKRLYLSKNESIIWLSPRPGDNFAEYSDDDFIRIFSLKLIQPLQSFWPTRGPVWDGLARTAGGKILLVEAKAHIPELKSYLKAEASLSCTLINKSLGEAKDYYFASPMVDWTQPYYQYANRLAHLYFLREVNKIDACLIFIYFMKDADMNGPRSKSEWKQEIERVHNHLDVDPDRLGENVVDLFIDVTKLD